MNKIFNYIKRKPLIIIFLIIVILLLFALLKNPPKIEGPSKTPQFTVSYNNSWENIQPGVSKLENSTSNLGDMSSSKKVAEIYKMTEYHKGKSKIPTQVITSQDGTIQQLRVDTIVEDDWVYLSDKKQEYGLGEDYETYFMNGQPFVKLYVYFDEGLAFEVSEERQLVYKILYFSPTSPEKFLEIWKDYYNKELLYQGH